MNNWLIAILLLGLFITAVGIIKAEDKDHKEIILGLSLIVHFFYVIFLLFSTCGSSTIYPTHKYIIKDLYSTSYGEFVYIDNNNEYQSIIREISPNLEVDYFIEEKNNAFGFVIQRELLKKTPFPRVGGE